MNRSRFAALAALFASAALSQADVLVNTFGPTGVGYFPTVGWTVDGGSFLGKTFSTAAAYNFSGIDVALRMAQRFGSVLGPFAVRQRG